jgi:hypothetical protein
MNTLAGRALDYRKVIDDFVAKTRELKQYELTSDDWNAIKLVYRWLKALSSATTQMSTTKKSMLSSTQAIFWGLQESLQNSLRELLNNAPPHLKQALVKAHHQLSEYYTKFDKSPYYIWSSCESTVCYFLTLTEYHRIILQCLTPRSHMRV